MKNLLHERYEIKEVLGQGGFATTYLAFDTETQHECALKCLSFRKIEEWKTWELFEREAEILKNLNHPQIPKYLDFFAVETEQDVQLYLVQEYVEGKSLAQIIQEGRHFTEQEILQMALGLTNVLDYLHRLSPPIIHRDLKPSNIVIQFPSGEGTGVESQHLYLIDFGSVKDKLREDRQGAPTIVGTYGYMPIEQTEGRTVPASDIYALGMTLIYLLSHTDPSQMEKRELRVDFRPYVNISREFADILDRMIEPDWRKRYQHVADLRRDLEQLVSGKPPVKVGQTKRVRTFVAAAVTGVLVFAMGLGFYLFLAYPPTPQPVVSTPAPIQASPQPAEIVISPRNGTISVNIYRDFTFQPTGFPLGLSVGQTTAGGLDTLPYEKLLREPEYRAEKVLYGYLPLGNGDDRQISFALDETDRPTWVAYVDANNNEDLTDDGPPYRNEGTGKFAANIKTQIEIITLTEETIIQPYLLWMWVTDSPPIARFYATCHYAGKIALDGTVYDAVVFEQFNHDGRYRESGLWIDLNQDGRLDEQTEHFSDGDSIRLNQRYYRLELQYP
jgi:hypothetical protein